MQGESMLKRNSMQISQQLVHFLVDGYDANQPDKMLQRKIRESDRIPYGHVSGILDQGCQVIQDVNYYLMFCNESVNKEAFRP